MNALTLLKQLNACSEALSWVASLPTGESTTVTQAWKSCPRGDWMLWFYQMTHPDNLRELTLAKGHCANTVRHLMTDPRSLKAVDTAIAFGEGRATREELAAAAAAYAANAAAYTAYTTYTATYAAAAAYAANAAAYTAYTTYTATYAAAAYTAYTTYTATYAAAAYAAYAAAAAAYARTENLLETANICRKYLSIITE